MAAALEKEVIKGGAFLLQETLPASVYSPEDFTEEQLLIGQTTTEFFDKEIIPNSEKIESKDYEIQRELIKKGADLGLINASIPEEYDGLELDHVSNMLIAENTMTISKLVRVKMARCQACHKRIGVCV